MKKIKVRKIGNSIGIILPKESGLKLGDILTYSQKGNQIILDSEEEAKEHDRELIEKSFADYDAKRIVTEAQMVEKFGRYGWMTAES